MTQWRMRTVCTCRVCVVSDGHTECMHPLCLAGRVRFYRSLNTYIKRGIDFRRIASRSTSYGVTNCLQVSSVVSTTVNATQHIKPPYGEAPRSAQHRYLLGARPAKHEQHPFIPLTEIFSQASNVFIRSRVHHGWTKAQVPVRQSVRKTPSPHYLDWQCNAGRYPYMLALAYTDDHSRAPTRSFDGA